MLMYEMQGVFIAMQLQQLLSLPAGSIPDKCKIAVYDGDNGIGIYYGNGTEVPYGDHPDWFSKARTGDDVVEFVGIALTLLKQREVRYPDMCVDAKFSAVTFVDKTESHTRVLARTVTDVRRVAGMHFPTNVLVPLAPLDEDPEGRITLALARDEDHRLEVRLER